MLHLVCVSFVPHLVLTGFIQDIQRLHGNGLISVIKLSDEELDAPVTEKLHTCSQEDTQVLGSVESAAL